MAEVKWVTVTAEKSLSNTEIVEKIEDDPEKPDDITLLHYKRVGFHVSGKDHHYQAKIRVNDDETDPDDHKSTIAFHTEDDDGDPLEIGVNSERLRRQYTDKMDRLRASKRLFKNLPGIGTDRAEILVRAGYRSLEDLDDASQSEIRDLPKFGNALAARLKHEVDKRLEETRKGLITGSDGETKFVSEPDLPEWVHNKTRPDGVVPDPGINSFSISGDSGDLSGMGALYPELDLNTQYAGQLEFATPSPKHSAIGQLLMADDPVSASLSNPHERERLEAKLRETEELMNMDPIDDPDDFVEVCPGCGEEFISGDDDTVEGDDGTEYCSLKCLNKQLS